MFQNGGEMVTDGTVVWIIDDVRDGTPVGAVRGSLYLPAGYVKANGATVQRADYPRLVALADKHSIWTDDTAANAGLFGRGDGAATFVLPNWTDRMVQLAGAGAGASIAAGLPNITGHIDYDSAGNIDYRENGCLSTDKNKAATGTRGSSVDLYRGIHIDASRSNPIYGRSDTVQPAAIKLIPIIRY